MRLRQADENRADRGTTGDPYRLAPLLPASPRGQRPPEVAEEPDGLRRNVEDCNENLP
jgi:hypothetical protein